MLIIIMRPSYSVKKILHDAGQQKSSVAAIVGGVLGGVIALGIIIFLIALSVVLLVSDHIRKLK